MGEQDVSVGHSLFRKLEARTVVCEVVEPVFEVLCAVYGGVVWKGRRGWGLRRENKNWGDRKRIDEE